jgi:hypothetical protein
MSLTITNRANPVVFGETVPYFSLTTSHRSKPGN